MELGRFAIFPVELIKADLTGTELRVLIALYSFRDKKADTVWPGLGELSARSGIKDKSQVSKLTSRLAEKGFLSKKKSGFKGNNRYTLIVPNLDKTTNLDESAITNLVETTNTNLVETTKLNKHTKEHTNEHTKARVPFSQLLTLWRTHFPHRPQIEDLNESRKSLIRARWNWVVKKHGEEKALPYFEDLFKAIVSDAPWLASEFNGFTLPWLMRQENFLKTVEGNYWRRD